MTPRSLKRRALAPPGKQLRENRRHVRPRRCRGLRDRPHAAWRHSGRGCGGRVDVVATRPIYAGVHIAAVFAALLILAGPLAWLARTHPIAWALGRFGVATSLVGVAIFGVESTSEGGLI